MTDFRYVLCCMIFVDLLCSIRFSLVLAVHVALVVVGFSCLGSSALFCALAKSSSVNKSYLGATLLTLVMECSDACYVL